MFEGLAVPLSELSLKITLGRSRNDFHFPATENAIFVPLIGISNVVDLQAAMTLKVQNYAQVLIDPLRASAQFVSMFLNSELGKKMRERNKTGAVILKLNTQGLRNLSIFLPSLSTQQSMLEIESQLTAERDTISGLQAEIGDLQRELWSNPQAVARTQKRLTTLSLLLSKLKHDITVISTDEY